jgi:AhpD family alkylhydroperoxidase
MARLTSRTMLSHVRHVRPVPPGSATGDVARVYRQAAEDFGMYAPPLLLHSPAPQLLAACWLLLRETLLARGLVARSLKETVAEAVSAGNRCPYCVEVHGAAATALRTRIPAGAPPELVLWAERTGQPSGRPVPPFAAEHRAELIGVAVTFHYINRLVTIFLRGSALPDAPQAARRAIRWLLGSVAGVGCDPGRSLQLLPAAPTTAALGWAREQPHIEAAAARWVSTVDAAGTMALSRAARSLVTGALDDPPATGPGAAATLNDRLRGLAPDEVPLARLALLSAVAPYRVADGDIAACRAAGADDRALVTAASWAAMTAARRIGAVLSADGREGLPIT